MIHLRSIVLHADVEGLLPKLTTIRGIIEEDSSLEEQSLRWGTISPFISSSTLRLDLRFSANGLFDTDLELIGTIMEYIGAKASSLVDLIVDIRSHHPYALTEHPKLAVGWLSALKGLPNLQSLHLPCVWFGPTLLQVLDSLPARRIFCNIEESRYDSLEYMFYNEPVGDPRFKHLRLLSLQGHFKKYLELLPEVSLPEGHPLEFLTIAFSEFDPVTEQICANYARHFPVIEELYIDTMGQLGVEMTPLSAACLGAFSRSSQLTALEIKLIDTTDDELGALLDSWPDLRRLTLRQSGNFSSYTLRDIRNPPSGLTLNCLKLIAQKLPKLSELTIQLSAASTEALGRSEFQFQRLIVIIQIEDSFKNFMREHFNYHRAAEFIDSLKGEETRVFFLNNTIFWDEDEETEEQQYRLAYCEFVEVLDELVKSKERKRKLAEAKTKMRKELDGRI